VQAPSTSSVIGSASSPGRPRGNRHELLRARAVDGIVRRGMRRGLLPETTSGSTFGTLTSAGCWHRRSACTAFFLTHGHEDHVGLAVLAGLSWTCRVGRAHALASPRSGLFRAQLCERGLGSARRSCGQEYERWAVQESSQCAWPHSISEATRATQFALQFRQHFAHG